MSRTSKPANTPQERNRHAWDDRVRQRAWYIDTATEQDFKNPLAVIDPCGWLGGDVTNKRLLCLAAGGGRHSALFATAGARVTVLDLSPKMLECARRNAAAEGCAIETVETDMVRLPFDDASFDLVVGCAILHHLPDPVVASAWAHLRSCQRVEEAPLRAFIDERVGKGPGGHE